MMELDILVYKICVHLVDHRFKELWILAKLYINRINNHQ